MTLLKTCQRLITTPTSKSKLLTLTSRDPAWPGADYLSGFVPSSVHASRQAFFFPPQGPCTGFPHRLERSSQANSFLLFRCQLKCFFLITNTVLLFSQYISLDHIFLFSNAYPSPVIANICWVPGIILRVLSILTFLWSSQQPFEVGGIVIISPFYR